MDEALLQFIWKFLLFDTKELSTQSGEPLKIVHPGYRNKDAGPDFANGKIILNDMAWAGNIELHLRTGDWKRHRHESDKSYNNVILHVVYEDDGVEAKSASGSAIPLLVLKNRIRSETLARYRQLMEGQNPIPCAPFFPSAAPKVLPLLLSRLMIERLEEKTQRVAQILQSNRYDWEHTAFQLLARYFGASVNKEPLEMLARTLPVRLWGKYVGDPLQLEALLFGQAGLLEKDFEDDYPRQLKKEFLYLKRLHHLSPLPAHVWKQLRLRPSNFPAVRIAQLAAFISKEQHLFSALTEAATVQDIHRLFAIDVSPYWKTHYALDTPPTNARTKFGTATKNILLINAVAPLLFSYGKHKGNEAYCDRALALLESCPPEANALLRDWQQLGAKPANAFESQALLQLRTAYCDQFRCLSCAVGMQILK